MLSAWPADPNALAMFTKATELCCLVARLVDGSTVIYTPLLAISHFSIATIRLALSLRFRISAVLIEVSRFG